MSHNTIFIAVESVVRKKTTSISNDVAWLKCWGAAEVPDPWPDLWWVRKQEISVINIYPMSFQSLSFMVITLLGIIKQNSLLYNWNKFTFRVRGTTDSPVIQNLFQLGQFQTWAISIFIIAPGLGALFHYSGTISYVLTDPNLELNWATYHNINTWPTYLAWAKYLLHGVFP